MKRLIKFAVFVVVLSVFIRDARCNDDEFVTLWTPKFAHENRPFHLSVLPTSLNENTEICVQFRNTSSHFILNNGKLKTVEYTSKNRHFGNKKSLNFGMTLYRKVNDNQFKCSTKELELKPALRNFYIFIQTDNPIYKPDDQVQFRILVVDKDMKPFHMNNINVTIADPFDRPIMVFDNLDGMFQGVYENNFNLSSAPPLGDWRINVVVNKRKKFMESKIFAVQKYTLPLFAVHVDMPLKHVLKHMDITMSIYAKYPFGEYVKGSGKLIIRRLMDGKVFVDENFSDVEEPLIVTKNIEELGIATENEMKFDVFVEFTEPESGETFSKTTNFYVHYDQKYKIKAVHPEKFLPGLPFVTKVFVYNWKNEMVEKHFEKVFLRYVYMLDNGETGGVQNLGNVKNGVMTNEFLVPKNYKTLEVEVMFIDSVVYRKEIPQGLISIGINSLAVDYLPKNPKLYDDVNIIVKSDTELDDIMVIVTSRHGNVNIKNQQIKCERRQICEFNLQIDDKMLPHSTVVVYDVRDKMLVYQGMTTIETENLAKNSLSLDMSKTKAKTKESVSMEFKTKPKSKIYLLAFDKRLTYLREGNDIAKSDVVKSVADYDGINLITIDDLSAWHPCTDDELKRLEDGRKNDFTLHTGDVFRPDEEDDTEETPVYEPDFPQPEGDASDPDLLREYFPETWIFKTIDAKDATVKQSFKTPDSITAWLVSAFSVHKTAGIALAPTQELIVMNEFFMKMSLPYSIRYKEILRLDILVYNYVPTNEQLDVTVTVHNSNNGQEFQFVEFGSDDNFCSPEYSNKLAMNKQVTVASMSVKRVSFFIRSNPSDSQFSENERKRIRIQADATAKRADGTEIIDKMVKKLTVEPVGIKTYKVIANAYKLDGQPTPPDTQSANYTEALTRINVVVSGDFLSNAMQIDDMYEMFPYDCLEQKTSKLKRNAETYRYLKFKDKSPSCDPINKIYQSIIDLSSIKYNYKDFTWYRAYRVDALATAMKSGAIPEDRSKIEAELEYLMQHQISNGTFTNFNFYFKLYGSGDVLKFSERYFSTAYCLIPFLKHRDIIDKSYIDVIEKSFKYLDTSANRLQVSREALSIAAYAYALDGRRTEARTLLDKVNEVFIDHGNNRKCFKIQSNDDNCNSRHTAYVAMALIKIKDLTSAEKLIQFLMETKLGYDYMQQTYTNAILTQAIAEMGMSIRSEVTNVKVTMSNDHGFKKEVEVTKDNAESPQDTSLPAYSNDVTTTVSGYGYCSISRIFERILIVPQSTPTFDLNVVTSGGTSNEVIVKVCVKYDSRGTGNPVLVNVVYEVNLPSGYIYNGIVDLNNQKAIKQISERRRSTLVVIYYSDFNELQDYCVEIKARKLFEVRKATAAGVKVYDYNEKANVAVDFYQPGKNDC